VAPTTAALPSGSPALRRRDLQKEQTRFDLAAAAFELAKSRGLADVRVPEIAAAVGVSTRTFNNYFASKEQAIAWLAGRHAAGMARALRITPAEEPLREALMDAVIGQYRPGRDVELPPHWLSDFRSLVAHEPALHGEYLRAMASAERDLADAIEAHAPGARGLRARVLAATVVGAERAAVMYWMENRSGSFVGTVRDALGQALAGIGEPASPVR
jgi:AcrR family transcriptional regulator